MVLVENDYKKYQLKFWMVKVEDAVKTEGTISVGGSYNFLISIDSGLNSCHLNFLS